MANVSIVTFARLTGFIVLALGFSTPAGAELQPRLGGLAVYDTDLNVTWLANANLAATNQFGTAGVETSGLMNWSTAQNWIASMNAAKYLGFSKWRLPATLESDPTCSQTGFGCTGSELGHLLYTEMGAQAGKEIWLAHNSNYDLFNNIGQLSHGRYWSGTTYSQDSARAWVMTLLNCSQALDFKTSPHYILPVMTGDVAASSVLPQFAFGGGWYSALYFTNRGSSAVSFPVNFISDLGGPLNVPSVGGASAVVNLDSRGTAIIEAPNAGQLSEGYVSLALPLGVEAYGVFRQSIAGRPDQEAVVPLCGAFSTSATLIWDDTGSTTAVAIVNPSVVATTVSTTVRNANGLIIGTSNVPLPANNKVAVVLRDLPGLSAMLGNRGSVDFTVASGSVAVLGLRFGGAAFTSIPTAQQ